jgi:hypothetical protein
MQHRNMGLKVCVTAINLIFITGFEPEIQNGAARPQPLALMRHGEYRSTYLFAQEKIVIYKL